MTARVRRVPLDRIVVPRGRRPIGDITDLARSIARVGLLHPIVVTPDLRLVAGLHRLRACQGLGWKTISATVLSVRALEVELAELDENLVRNELTVLERADQLRQRKQLYEALHPEAVKAGRPKKGETVSSFSREVARKTRLTPRTVQHEIQIASAIPSDVKKMLRGTVVEDDKRSLLRLARMPGPEQRSLVERIVSGEAKSVRQAMVQSVAMKLGRRRRGQLDGGPYDVVVIDPPWPYESQRTEYPTMTMDEIERLPVPAVAAPNCVLWLWTTNAMMRHAYSLLDAWGFTEKTILTWVKTRSTLGSWLLNTTEHVILAVRGQPVVNLTTQTTAFRAPNREHSRKPNEFYALVESLCPGSKLDMFARETRKGWTTWGAERTKFDRRTG